MRSIRLESGALLADIHVNADPDKLRLCDSYLGLGTPSRASVADDVNGLASLSRNVEISSLLSLRPIRLLVHYLDSRAIVGVLCNEGMKGNGPIDPLSLA